MANLAELLETRFGVKTETRRSAASFTVGTAAAQILRNDPKRLAALIVNLSGDTLFVSPFRDVGSANGVRLGGGGGTFSLIWDEDFDLTAYEWFAVSTAAGSAVFVLEVVAR